MQLEYLANMKPYYLAADVEAELERWRAVHAEQREGVVKQQLATAAQERDNIASVLAVLEDANDAQRETIVELRKQLAQVTQERDAAYEQQDDYADARNEVLTLTKELAEQQREEQP